MAGNVKYSQVVLYDGIIAFKIQWLLLSSKLFFRVIIPIPPVRLLSVFLYLIMKCFMRLYLKDVS